MRSDMWRLYRHVLIGGIIISLGCYGAIEWLQQRYYSHQHAQLWQIDAELSALLYQQSLLSLDELNAFSVYEWDKESNHAFSATSTFNIQYGDMANVAMLADGQVLLSGSLREKRKESVLILLRHFLVSSASYNEKVDILKSLDVISLKPVDAIGWPEVDLYLKHISPDILELQWQPENGAQAWVIQVQVGAPVSISVAVLLIILLAISALLILVWIEFLGLDRKRAHFETVTRQIARGRGTLPQGVVDSSGTLKELAYSFDSMSTHIQRLLKVQREMINAISHELRTPIARLRFGLEVLKDDVDEALEHSITALEFDVEELNTLVDEVLTYGKLEEGTLALNFEKTSIQQILDSIVDHNHTLLNKLDVRIVVQGDDLVNADAHHLHRALQNLILNASKYANSTIAITFTADEERWQVDIEDDGPGIPIEDRDKVFIPFQRLDNSRTRASGGYGLGLAIVQRIAFWHGGAVLIDSSELGGAKFSLIWSRSQHQNSLS